MIPTTVLRRGIRARHDRLAGRGRGGPGSPSRLIGPTAGVVLAVTAVCLWPVAALVLRAPGLPAPSGSLVERLGNAEIAASSLRTVAQAALSTLGALFIGLPAGLVLGRYRIPGRGMVTALAFAPFVLPSVVVGAAFVALLPGWPVLVVIVAAHACFNAGLVARAVSVAVAGIDSELLDAARSLGARRVRLAALVTRLIRAQIAGVAVIVFALCAVSFGVVVVVGGGSFRTLETEVWYQTTRVLDLPVASLIAFAQLAVLLPMAMVRPGALATVGEPRRAVEAKGWGAIAAIASIAALLSLAAVPLVRLGWSSLQEPGGGLGLGNYRSLAVSGSSIATRAAPLSAVGRSLAYASAAAATTMAIALLAGWADLARGRRSVAGIVSMIPIGVSGATLGLGLLVAYGRSPLDLRGSPVLLVAAEVAVALPVSSRLVRDAAAAIPRAQIEAALDLGARFPVVVRTVVTPQIRGALITATGFAMAIGLGEVAAASFLARSDAPTVPVEIARLMGRAGSAARGQAMAMSFVLAALCGAIWFAAEQAGRPSRQRRRSH